MLLGLYKGGTRDDFESFTIGAIGGYRGKRRLAWHYVDCRGTHARRGDGLVNGYSRRKIWKTFQKPEQT